MLIGAIETGGTKTVCGVVTVDGEILARTRFPTESPAKTLGSAIDYLMSTAAGYGVLSCIGIGSFGPLDLRRDSPGYGRLLKTPKSGWTGTDLLGELAVHTDLPVAIDTDVNCALLGEMHSGAARGLSDCVYLTVGTGIGAGILSDGRILHGRLHPEVGHMLLPRHEDDIEFDGPCPFHGNRCAEGLASGPAMMRRWDQEGSSIPADHRAWRLEAHYLAALCVNLLLTTAPQRIILGGGVMSHGPLIHAVRKLLNRAVEGYLSVSVYADSINDLVVTPQLRADAGILGAAVLAAAGSESVDFRNYRQSSAAEPG